MKRREFIAGLGSMVAWPVVARAQQGDRVRRIGVLTPLVVDDPETLRNFAALQQGLQDLGWTEGRNVRFDYRWGGGNADRYSTHAAELVALAPDVLIANAGSVLGVLQRATRTIPIVFVSVVDPVGAGRVASLARPGGNSTGFAAAEFGISGKWLELLKQMAPGVTRAAVVRDPTTAGGLGYFGAIRTAAPSLHLEIIPIDGRDAGEIERSVVAFAGNPNGGLIVLGGTSTNINRGLIIALAARHRLPAVYSSRYFMADGGLISYSPVIDDYYRRAAGYIDRILKGEKPADLPVQVPTKYETILNLKTAKALGLTIPETLLATADEVIQ
jgi:putative tryptophan/tyrosine transport system substrate-binding protein